MKKGELQLRSSVSIGRPDEMRSVMFRSILAAALPVWSLLLVVWFTWTPFRFTADIDLDSFFPQTSGPDVLSNLLLFAPFALILGLRWPDWSVRRIIVVTIAVSLSIELGQLFSPERVASPLDLALNTAGAGGAAWMTRGFRHRRLIQSVCIGAVYAGLVGLAIHSGRTFKWGMRLDGWNPAYGIAAGNEFEVDRRYVGSVSDALLCAGEGANRVCAEPGADQKTRVRLVVAAERDQEFEVVARVVSQSDTQSGPTRILTFSQGAYLRNVTVGQDSTALVIRIRTPLMGLNGAEYELHMPDAIHEGVVTDIRTRFRRGVVRTVIKTTQGTRTVHHVFGAFSGGIIVRGGGPILPGHAIARHLFMILLAVPPLALLGEFVARRARGS